MNGDNDSQNFLSSRELYRTLTQIQIDIAEVKRDMSWIKERVNSICSDVDVLSTEIDSIKQFKSKIYGSAMAVSFLVTTTIAVITMILKL